MFDKLVHYVQNGPSNVDGSKFKTFAMHTYDELKDMTLLQRLQLGDWRLELFTISFSLIFIFLYKFGDWLNTKKVERFLDGVKGVFSSNFHLFGVGSDQLYVKDSSENFSSYASGRENISKVDLKFSLAPRHNIFIWLMELLFAFFTESVVAAEDKVDITITPSFDHEHFITAIASKVGMNDARKFNYYLSLTKTVDSASLPESFVFMSEANEFQEKTFTEKISQSLNTSMASYLKFVAFTDQPSDRPEVLRDLIPNRRIVVSLRLVSGKKQLAEISQLLDAVFDLLDQIASKQITFSAEASRKIIRARENEVSKIKKIEDSIRQEELAEEKAKLKRKEKDDLKKLSKDEQFKLEQKAQGKKQRKAMKKMRARG